jgi:hypothetical protein
VLQICSRLFRKQADLGAFRLKYCEKAAIGGDFEPE